MSQMKDMTNQRRANGPVSGGKYIDTIDDDDPEYERQMRRPVEVKEDVREMEERKRVNQILKSKAFRTELEDIVVDHLKTGPAETTGVPGLLTLEQIAELFVPTKNRTSSTGMLFGRTNGPIVAISDIRTGDVVTYAKGERLLRCKLAACYRLVDMFGWSQGVQSYITARVGPDVDHVLVIPHGMTYSEVTASSLAKTDGAGAVLDAGSTGLGVNRAGLALHSAVYAARPDIKCVLHVRCPSAVSVSAMSCGLLPLCQDAMSLGDVARLEVTGSLSNEDEKVKLRKAFTPTTKVLFITNNGVVVGGESVEEALYVARNVMNAVDTQLRTVPLGLDNIHLPSDETRRKAYELANQPPQSVDGKTKWRRGELEFEALMRHLDNAGYRTGYIYNEPLVRNQERSNRTNSEVEVPPTSTSFSYGPDGDVTTPEALGDKKKKAFLNTSNTYKKEEVEQSPGAPNSRKITKWVPEGTTGTLIKIEDPHQFAPIGSNPKELKTKVQSIRKEYFDEKITAGPQSKILEGMTWEEAQRIKEGEVQSDKIIIVGAASRGIIQREHRNKAAVYQTYYPPNPFDNVTAAEVENYKSEVIRKTRGDTGEPVTSESEGEGLEPGPDGRLISTTERMHQIRLVSTEPVAAEVPSAAAVSWPAERPSSSSTRPSSGTRPPPVRETNLDDDIEPMAGGDVRTPAKKPVVTEHKVSSRGDSATTSPAPSSVAATPEPQSTKEGKGKETESTEKKKKKRGFRMPSFSSKKKDKEKQ